MQPARMAGGAFGPAGRKRGGQTYAGIAPAVPKEWGEGLYMENRITVTICGSEYTLMAQESPSYIQKVASIVDEKMTGIMTAGRMSRVDAAVLTATNLADDLLKARQDTENLRGQVKTYSDEVNRLKDQLSEAKRDNFKLQQRLDKLEKQK